MMGNDQTRLIVIRGNSGSGKSALAAAIRAARPRGIAIIGQDVLRRDILHLPDTKPSLAADYIELSAHFALDRGLHAIVEGILRDDIYGDMLRRLVADHLGITRCYRYEIPFQETLDRHRTKPNATDFGEREMRRWWREDDRLTGVEETIIGPELSLADTAAEIIADCGWASPLPNGAPDR